MVDFSSLLSKPAGLAKKPPALPPDPNYTGVVKSYETGDQNKNRTPYIRFNVGLTGWPDSVAEGDRATEDGTPIDLAKKTLRRDYFYTDDALWRLDAFLRGIGMDMGTEDAPRSYLEILPETVGTAVMVDLGQYMNQQNNEIGNQINELRAIE